MEVLADELAFAKKRIAKGRRIMEGQGGGEVRRIHIIYFLSRKGRIEHPHLIRVHHFSRSGVHLRDVKRWLSELRGKDMADSFAWSYKRRYKTGFLWQDLVDEDLITPVSDNEYVLKGSEIKDQRRKGSEISSSTFINDLSSYGKEKEVIMQKEHPQTPMDDSTQKSFEIEELSLPYGTQATTTEDSIKVEEQEDSDSPKEKNQEREDEENKRSKFGSYSFYSNLMNKRENNGTSSNTSTPDSSASFSSNSSFLGSKSHKHGKSSMLRSLMSCRVADTMDSATVKINKQSKNSTTSSNNTREICKAVVREIKREQQNGERKSGTGSKDLNKNKKSGFGEAKTVSAAYRPINGPKCSQCGRQFKPEKMHTHMKSCRGVKAFPKSEKTTPHSNSSMDSPQQDSVSGYYYSTHK